MKERQHQGREKVPEKAPGIIYKFLRLFTIVHPGEAFTLFLLTINIFFILVVYYILKPVRKGLLLTKYEAEQESYLFAAVAVLLIFVIKIFSYLSSKIPRHKLITSVTLFFISNLVLFFILNSAGTSLKILGPVFWIWLSIFNVFIIAQFWAFSNDLYTEEAGKRLFPIIMFGQNLGSYIGGKSTAILVKPNGPFSVFQLMLLAGAILGISIVLTLAIHKREIKRVNRKNDDRIDEKKPEKRAAEKPLKKGGGFRVVFKSRYLVLIAFMILALNYVNTTGEYIKSGFWTRAADQAAETGKIESTDVARTEFITKTEADFLSLVNLFTMLIQLFLVSRIFKWFGVRVAILFLPFIALGGYSILSVGATLALVKWTKVAENSTDYSLMNTVKQTLYLITSREAKYKAKAAIDTFFVRAGDVLHALTVFIGTTYLALHLENFAQINIVVALIWIILCFLINRDHKKLSAEQGHPAQI